VVAQLALLDRKHTKHRTAGRRCADPDDDRMCANLGARRRERGAQKRSLPSAT
jgi:hypothetical protein